jgi:hypothetical protein
MSTLSAEHPLALGTIALFAMGQLTALVLLLRRTSQLNDELRNLLKKEPSKAQPIRSAHLPFVMWARRPRTSVMQTEVSERREAAVSELEDWFFALPEFQFLQRSGYVSPLLGVLITAFGFLNSRAINTSDTTDGLLQAVSPLVLGIAGGASLAILAQVFLFIADWLLVHLRRLSLSCFEHLAAREDPCAATGAFVDLAETARNLRTLFADVPEQLKSLLSTARRTDRTLGAASTAMDAVANTFTESVALFHEIVEADLRPLLASNVSLVATTDAVAQGCQRALQQSAAAAAQIETAGTRLLEINEGYAATLEKIVLPSQRQLTDSAKKITALATSLGQPLEVFVEAASSFGESLTSTSASIQQLGDIATLFGQGVRSHFLPAAEGHHNAVRDIEGASAALRDAGQTFSGTLSVLSKTVQAHRDAGEHLVELVEEKSVPAHEILHACVKQLQESAADLAQCTEGYMQSALQSAAEVTRLSESIATLAPMLEILGQRLQASLQDDAIGNGRAHNSADDSVASSLSRLAAQFQECIDALRSLQKQQQVQNGQLAQLLSGSREVARTAGSAIPMPAASADHANTDHRAARGSDSQESHQSELGPSQGTAPAPAQSGFGGFTSLWQRKR